MRISPLRGPFRLLVTCLLGTSLILASGVSTTPNALAQTATRADTTVIRPRAGGVWRTARTAVELLRLDGVGEGGEFGQLQDVLALTDGGVVVFDGQSPQGSEIVVLDSMGRLVRRLGRRGAGPGEFAGRANLGSLAEGPDGEIWLLDAINNRINRWSRDGRVLTAMVPRNSIGPVLNIPLLRGPNGTAYVPAQVRRDPSAPFGNHLHGALVMAQTGEIMDTLSLPLPPRSTASPSPYAPRTLFHPLPAGGRGTAQTHAASVYISGNRSARVLKIDLPIRAAAFLPKERSEIVALAAFQAIQMKSTAPEVPLTKPVIARIQVNADGTTLWLQYPAEGKAATAEWHTSLGGGAPTLTFLEPTRFVALRTDGTYLGQVTFEGAGIRKVSFQNGSAWGIVTSADGVQSLVKWQLPR